MSPPNQTLLPPDATAQEAQSVWFLSKAVRAEVCWQGRQEMRAVMLLLLLLSLLFVVGEGAVEEEEVTEMRFSPKGAGARVMSMSCHQSSSTVFLTPFSWNH